MSEAPKNSDLQTRATSAIVMLAIAGGAVYVGTWVFTAFAGLVAMIALWEWRALAEKLTDSAGSFTALVLAGCLYIGAAVACLIFLRDHVGVMPLLAVLGVVICTDIGAYFTGRTFGGPKIAPAISPSKTWSGLIGGMVAAGLFAGWIAARIHAEAGFAVAFLFGAALAVLAQAGDFLESGMKRRAGVKDSGNLIPGHGGVLDRIDGMLPVAIVATFVLVFASR